MSNRSLWEKCRQWVVVLAVLSFGCGDATQTVYVPPLTTLLARPNDFNGEAVEVFGYLYRRANLALSLTKDHAIFGDSTSRVFVVIPSVDPEENLEACIDSYVHVEGRFKFDSETSPSLVNITRVFSMVNRECDWRPASGTDVEPPAA